MKKSMYKIAIIDDEQTIIDQISSFINKICDENGDKRIINSYSSPTRLLEEYKTGYGVIFVDVMMPGLDGIEVAKRIRKIDSNVTIVFITSMAKFAIHGYEVGAFDYILKPVIYEDFYVRFKKILYHIDSKGDAGNRIVLKVKGTYKIINSNEIVYIESDAHYITYHTFDQDIVQRGKLSDAMNDLDPDMFAYCNQCYIVNLKYVSKVDDSFVYTVNNDELLISRAKKKSFMSALAEFYLRG